MDNPWYDYSPYPLRPKLTWPRNARVASFVLLHLEYWELIPDEGSHRDPRLAGEFGSYVPDYRSGRSASTATGRASSASWTCSTATRSGPALR